MNSTEKEISYNITNTYSTLNTLTEKTKNVWFVCHGIDYLSRYFLKYFEELNPKENYIIAPQASSKHYLGNNYKHVGASWLTKENTNIEIENVMRNFDAIFEAEHIPRNANLIILGYSQGVSVALRYVAKRQLQCSHLVMMSGGIPNELTLEDFKFLKGKVIFVFGTNDEYINEERLIQELNKGEMLFGDMLQVFLFEGKHEVNTDFINNLL
ncbi:MAG TPA: hypothetical protein VKN14_02990 [Flavobacteriaceae bacterium]|nr:hypothetical protein [Flavobacteriaceae bacterium]